MNGLRLSEVEIGALARRLVAEHLWSASTDGTFEWEDVPLLVEDDWLALDEAISAFARDLHTLSRRYDEDTGVDSQWLLGRVRG